MQLLPWAEWVPRIIVLYVLCHTLWRRLIWLIEKLNRLFIPLIPDKSCIGPLSRFDGGMSQQMLNIGDSSPSTQ